MLIKTLKVINHYESGFLDKSSKITVEIFDVDRNVKIIEGDIARDNMNEVLKGIKIGINMAGYQVAVLPIEEHDDLTKAVRKLK